MNVSLCKSHLYLKVGRNESFSLNSRGKKMWIGPSYDAVKTYSSFAESCLILSVTSTIRLQPSRGIILPVEFPRFKSDFRRWQEIFQMAKIISYRLKRRTLHSFVYWTTWKSVTVQNSVWFHFLFGRKDKLLLYQTLQGKKKGNLRKRR